MTLPIPTLAEQRQQQRQLMAARLPGADLTLRRSALGVLSDVFAGGLYLEGRYLDGLAQRLFIDTCTGADLDRESAIRQIPRKAAEPAGGNVTFTGTTDSVVPAGTLLLAGDGVSRFATQSTVTLASGAATAAVVQVGGSAAGNLPTGALLALSVAVAGVNPSAVVQSPGLSGGVDLESDDSLRARLLARLRLPPQGGAAWDYHAWATDQPGVTRAWVFPLRRGAGTVDVTFVFDGRGVGAAMLPAGGDVTAMQTALDALRPVTANVQAFAPTTVAVPITIANLAPDTAAVRAAIAAQLADLFLAAATPGGASYGDAVDASNPAGRLYVTRIAAAIQQAAGIAHFDLSAPSSDVVAGSGVIPILGTITYV